MTVVVQRRSLDDDTERADQRDGGEQPEQQTIKHHRYELPVLLHLCTCSIVDKNIKTDIITMAETPIHTYTYIKF